MSEIVSADRALQPGLTSVIVVAADSGNGLLDCVRSVLASSVPVELLLSDNASGDGSIERVQQEFVADARISVVRNGMNLGFGAGVNRVAARARGDCLLILNPDCLVASDSIEQLRNRLQIQPRIGLIGVRVRNAEGIDEPASRRRDPTLQRSLNTLLGRARMTASRQGVNELPGEAAIDADRAVEAISGAVMLLPQAAFASVGGFDEGYFLHCEDLDLCRRLRDQGWGVLYAGSVSVVHGKGGSSRHRPVFVSWHKHRSMWRWFRKFDPLARHAPVAALVWCGLWTRFVLQLPLLLWRRLRRR